MKIRHKKTGRVVEVLPGTRFAKKAYELVKPAAKVEDTTPVEVVEAPKVTTKAKLLEEAVVLQLDVNEKNTIAEIKAAIQNALAERRTDADEVTDDQTDAPTDNPADENNQNML